MRSRRSRWFAVAGIMLALAVGVPTAAWVGLGRAPGFYRRAAAMPTERRREGARRFLAQGMQLRNDIANEPRWEAAFGDEEVNAWLAEDLVAYFADQIPPGVHDPRVAFEGGRVHLGFTLDEGPVRSVISVVAEVRVREPNTLALTLERVQAGLMPIPARRLTDRIGRSAERHGVELTWEVDGPRPVAVVRYRPDAGRPDVTLDEVRVFEGAIRLAGRSSGRRGAIAAPALPGRRVLQSTFPKAKTQSRPGTPVSARDRVSRPLS